MGGPEPMSYVCPFKKRQGLSLRLDPLLHEIHRTKWDSIIGSGSQYQFQMGYASNAHLFYHGEIV